MKLEREVVTDTPQRQRSQSVFVAKLVGLTLISALAIPIVIDYALQGRFHSCPDPFIVIISPASSLEDPELDAFLAERVLLRSVSECEECHSADVFTRSHALQEFELCRMDDPSCEWIYEINVHGRVIRSPNPRNGLIRLEKSESHTIKLLPSKTTTSIPVDMFRYESF